MRLGELSVKQRSLDETERANRAREMETNRSNLAQERLTSARNEETRRSNMQSEQLKQSQLYLNSRDIDIRAAAQRETERSNLARERETERSNMARENENIRSNLAREQELTRSNLAREVETNRSNVAREWEESRANQARERETSRHNTVSEGVDIGRAATYAVDVGGRLVYYNKDFSTNVVTAPVNTTSVGNTGSSGSGRNGPNSGSVGGPVNRPNTGGPNPGNSTSTNINLKGTDSNENGKTFWDIAWTQIQGQNGTGSQRKGASRAEMAARSKTRG